MVLLEDNNIQVILSEAVAEFDEAFIEIIVDSNPEGIKKMIIGSVNASTFNISIEYATDTDGNTLSLRITTEFTNVLGKYPNQTDFEFILNNPNITEDSLIESETLYEALKTEGMVGLASVSVGLLTGIVNMVTLNNPTLFWTITSTAQLISYLPILEIPISESLRNFLYSHSTAL